MGNRKLFYGLAVFLLFFWSNYAFGQVTLSVSDVAGTAGSTITVPVSVDAGDGTSGYQFALSYDDTLLSPSATPATTTALSSGWTLLTNTGTSGSIIVGLYDPDTSLTGLPQGSQGAIVEVFFDVAVGAASGATSSLALSSTVVSDKNALEVASAASTAGTFTVISSPDISALSPDTGVQGSVQMVTITGSDFQNGATCDFGSGVTVDSCAFSDSTTLIASLSIGSEASVGTRAITVTNPDTGTTTFTPGYNVTARPRISGVAPSIGVQGDSLVVTITGTDFQDGASCDFGSGVTVNSCAFASSTSMTASLSIDTLAFEGLRNVMVTNPDGGWDTALDAFQVAAAPAISGRVTEEGGSTGIANVEVVAIDTVTGDIESGRADAGGYYAIGGLGAGTYKVGVITQESIYIPEFYNDKASFSAADVVTAVVGQNTSNINFTLAKDTDKDGIPDSEESVAGDDGFVTDPALADSDGDGVNDLAEILAGTDPTDNSSIPTAEDLYSAGKQLLAGMSFMEANAAFGAAVTLDASHVGANFFYALTRLVAFFNSDGFLNLLRGFDVLTNGFTPLDENFGLVTDFPKDEFGGVILPTDFPTGAEVQAVFAGATSSLLSEVDGALNNLSVVAIPTFIDSINLDNVLFYQSVEFDYGDVLLLRSFLKFLRGQLLAFGAYDVDRDIDADLSLIFDDAIESLLDSIHADTGLFTLNTGHQLTTAKAVLSEAVDDYLAGSAFIRSETDDQTDDFFTIGENELEAEAIARQILSDFKQTLTGPAELRDGDPFDHKDQALPLDLTNFFDNIIADLKTLIPTSSDLTVDSMTGEILDIRFPDETANGILQFSTISGVVTESSEGAPLSGLRVFTFALDRDVDEETLTKTDGSYTLEGLLAGAYVVCVDASSTIYRFTCYDNATQTSTAGPVDLLIGEDKTGIDFALQPADSVFPSVQFAVHSINDSGAQKLLLDAFVNDPDGSVPSTISSITVSGPGLTDEPLVYTDMGVLQPRYRAVVNVAAASGTYTVTVKDADGNMVTASDTIEITTLSSVDSSSFSISEGEVLNNSSMIFSWRGLAEPDLYYMVYFFDDTGSIAATSSLSGSTRAVIDNGALLPGGTYTVQVAVFDDADFFSSDNISFSDTVSFTVDSLAAGPGSISGSVLAYETQSGIFGATVVAFDFSTSQPLAGAATDSLGNYTIGGLPPGTYRVGVFPSQESSYEIQYYNLRRFSSAAPVTVAADTTTSGVNFDLENAGVISGRAFVEEDFVPLEGIKVVAYLADTGELVTTGITDRSGNYTLSGLPPGEYILRAMDMNGVYLSEYFGDVILRSEAQRVTVSEFGFVDEIDFGLDAGGVITGTVTAGGQAVDGVEDKIQVLAYDADTGVFVGFAIVESDGTYELPVFSPGAYRLLAQSFKAGMFGGLSGLASQWYDGTAAGADHFGDALNVDVSSTVTGIDFALSQGGTISGSAIDSSSQPIFGVMSVAYDFDTGFLAGFARTPDYSGQYSIELPVGEYRIYFDNSDGSIPNGFFVDNFRSVAEQPEARPVVISNVGDAVGSINFDGGQAGSVSGVVTAQSSGQPIEGLRVEARDYFNDGFVKGARTDSQGRYSLKNLPRGSYRILIRADTKLYTDSFSRSDYISERYRDKLGASPAARPLAVEPDAERAGIDFSLETGGFIEGTVTATGSMPVQGILVLAQDIADTGSEFDRHELRGFAFTDADGAYRINVPAGTYRVSAVDLRPAPRYASAVFSGDVTVPSAATTTGIDFSLESGGLITGSVLNRSAASSNPSSPVLGVNVVAVDSLTGEPVGFNRPIYDGSYMLRAPAGTYKANVDPIDPGAEGQFYKRAPDFFLASPFTVSTGLTTSGIDFVPLTGGAIGGTVVDAVSGNPVSGLTILALDADQWWLPPLGSDVTDSSGAYVISGLDPGDYIVLASNSGTSYIDTFYDGDGGTFSGFNALPVNVRSFSSGIDFSLNTGSRISGSVLPAGAEVLYGWAGMSGGPAFVTFRIDPADNSFSWVMESGAYQGNTIVPSFDSGFDITDGGVIDLSSGDLSGYVVTLQQLNSSISGRVTDSGGSGLADIRVVAIDTTTMNMYETTTSGDGYYALGDLPTGTYNVGVITQGTVYLPEFYDDQTSFSSADTVTTSTGSDTPNIDFALDADSDMDGLPDSYETDTGAFVSDTDTGTDPNDADTDGDGVNDNAEILAGTDPTVSSSAPTAAQLVAVGKELFVGALISEADAAFKAALLLDPANLEANFFRSLSRFGSFLQSGGVEDILTDFRLLNDGVNPLAENFGLLDTRFPKDERGMSIFPTDFPTGADLQALLSGNTESLLAEVEAAIANLDVITSDSFTSTVTPNNIFLMDPIEFDYGDVLIHKASLKFMKSLLLMLGSYDVNIDVDELLTILEGGSLQTLLDFIHQNSNTALGTLNTVNSMSDAGAALTSAIADYLAGSAFIRSESDDQADDFVTIDAEDLVLEARFRAMLNDILKSTSGPAIVRDLESYQEQTPDERSYMLLDLSALFDTPPGDLKSLTPTGEGFTFDFYGTKYSSIFLNTNGGFTFGSGNDDWDAASSAITQPGVGIFWGDMDAAEYDGPNRPNQMTYEQFQDRFVITYDQFQDNDDGSWNNSAKVTLYPNGTIEIEYGTVLSGDILVGVFDGTHEDDRFLSVQSTYSDYQSTGTGIILFDYWGEGLYHDGELNNMTITFQNGSIPSTSGASISGVVDLFPVPVSSLTSLFGEVDDDYLEVPFFTVGFPDESFNGILPQDVGGIFSIVTDKSLNPLPGVTVNLFSVASNPVLVSSTTTDAEGFYEFAPLTPGDYLIQVETGVTPFEGVFYDGASDQLFASPVTVSGGKVLTGIDFSVDLDSDGDGIPDSEESILGNDGFITDPSKVDTDGDGSSDLVETLAGSDPTDGASRPSAAAASGAGISLLESGEVSQADAALQAALDANPADAVANFFRAGTRVGLILQNSTLSAIMDDFGFNKLGRDVFDFFAEPPTTLPSDSPMGQQVSNAVQNVIIPALSASIANLDNITDGNFATSFAPFGSTMGKADALGLIDFSSVEIDFADTRIISAMLGFQKGLMELATAHDIDFDIDSVLNALETSGPGAMLTEIKAQLSANTGLLTLLAETQLSTASATLKKAIEDYLEGSAAIRQEIDSQIDDLFQISAEDEAEEQRLRDVLVDVLPYFTEKTRVTVRDLDIYGVDPSEDLQRNDSFTLDLRHLFGSTVESITPADWRTLLNNAFLDGTTGKVALLDDTVDGILPMVNHPVTGERVVEGTAVSKVTDALCDDAATVADYLNLGVPFIPLAGDDAFTVLETLLGPRDGGVNWRLFKYDSSAGAFSEITAAGTDTFDFNTGYFLIATNGCQTDTIDFGITGVPALSLDDFTFTVEPGKWTLFSNPFHFDILNSVALSSDAPEALSDVFHWLTGVGTYEVADKLLPSESYFLFNDSSSPVQVVIFPISAETTSSVPITKTGKGAPGKAGWSAKYQPLPPALGAVGSEPYADVKTDRTRYFGGDTLRVSLNLYNPGPDTVVDVYLWLNDSRGNLYTYDLRKRRFVEGGQPTIASFSLPGGEALTDYVMARHLLVKENPLVEGRSIPGNYTVSVSLTKPGSAEPIGDLIDSAAFTVVDGKR